MKRALVLGVNGQDGSYLAESLIARGYDVVGVGRQEHSRWVDPARFRYRSGDMADAAALKSVLDEERPHEIYHMAAIHGSAGHSYEANWREALSVNVGAVHTCLEYIRAMEPEARLFYPSSLKVFGLAPSGLIDESHAGLSTCLYSVSKNAATELIAHYRREHGVWAAVGYYFNHDSPRRPDSYFLPRLTAQLAAQKTGGGQAPDVARLDFWCDWGSAAEFMELTCDLLQAQTPQDVIFATGRPAYAAALASDLAASIGLPRRPHGKPQPAPFRADIGRLRQAVGRTPHATAFDVASWILRERHGIAPDTSRIAS